MLSKLKIATAGGILLGAAFAISTSSGVLAETFEEKEYACTTPSVFVRVLFPTAIGYSPV